MPTLFVRKAAGTVFAITERLSLNLKAPNSRDLRELVLGAPSVGFPLYPPLLPPSLPPTLPLPLQPRPTHPDLRIAELTTATAGAQHGGAEGALERECRHGLSRRPATTLVRLRWPAP